MDTGIKPNWTRFFFESNQFFQQIESLADWRRLRGAYPQFSDARLLEAKEATYGGSLSPEDRATHPNYGFRWEHDGEKTLRDFFLENGMELPNQPALDRA